MLRLTDIRLPVGHREEELKIAAADRLGVGPDAIRSLSIFRRNHDARQKTLMFSYTVDADIEDEEAVFARLKAAGAPRISRAPDTSYRFDAKAPADIGKPGGPLRPVVIGCGPCGLFAALVLAQQGYRPVIIERGKNVRDRTQDTFGFWRQRELNPESNVQFGEGGAGTFSDGKLHTQIRDPRHLGRKVLTEFVKAGAPEEILYIGKPHIGTFKLVRIIIQMRDEITRLGGEYLFESRADDFAIEDGQIKGVVLSSGKTVPASHVILAPGHSARDTFEMLHKRGIPIEAKPFSVGFRIEHPQAMIDKCRLGSHAGNPLIGAADYKLVHHAGNGRTVYSFCMCPGGTVVAAASEPGQLVTNGMSQYSRNERNANAAIVVGIDPKDFPGYPHPLAGIALQRDLEKKAFELGGGNYNAPCQLVGDFLKGRPSLKLGDVVPSYQPGVTPADLTDALPPFAVAAMKEAIKAFDRTIPGFARPDAVLTGTETRTSSPVRIIRDSKTRESTGVKGLYPAGEGAGYAGGILSSAVDGIETAEAVALDIIKKYAA